LTLESVGPLDVAWLVVAGFGAGLAGSAAGLASLVSYPALLGVGLGPVAANVTNTIALVGTGVGSALGSRPELRGQRLRLRRLGIAAVLGGAVGGGLLLLTPPGTFEAMVPWLIGFASLAIVLRPRPGRPDRIDGDPDSPLVAVGIFLVAIYGGYFGAAAGVMILALLLASSSDALARSNAIKNVVLALANAVAAVTFALLGPVEWAAVVPLGVGCLVGGRLGPTVVRRLPDRLVRAFIGAAGLALAVKLGIDTYS
jgi:uncharacterized membrane protein YfcA